MSAQWNSIAAERTTETLSSGVTVELEALTLGDIAQVRRECLQQYREQKVEFWARNAERVIKVLGQQYVEAQLLKIEEIGLDDLPQKSTEVPQLDKEGKPQIDQETGLIALKQIRTEYPIWWISETVEGRLYAMWLSMRRCPGQENVTLDDCSRLMTSDLIGKGDLEEVAQKIGELTTPKMELPGKNLESSFRERNGRRERRRKRRKRGR